MPRTLVVQPRRTALIERPRVQRCDRWTIGLLVTTEVWRRNDPAWNLGGFDMCRSATVGLQGTPTAVGRLQIMCHGD
jgi:hypothetical protein